MKPAVPETAQGEVGVMANPAAGTRTHAEVMAYLLLQAVSSR